MLDERKRTWAEIKLYAVQYNIYQIREAIPEGCKICGVVKADAYGHGAVRMAKMLEKFHCDWLAAATLDEAEQLRAAGIELPILILGYIPAEFIGRVIKADCALALGSFDAAKAYSRVLEREGLKLRVHLKLETGMGRTGFDVKGGDVSRAASALALPGIETEGVFTHFSSADDPAQEEHTLRQLHLFSDAADKIENALGKKFALRHCANSAAMISYPQTHLDMVRVGLSLYGLFPGEDRGALQLCPVMELKTRIVQIAELLPGDSVSYGRTFTADRKMKIAVLPIGYADGLHRVLSGKLEFLINDKRCRQVGTICMDMCMVDVTDAGDVKLDDVATIFGHDKHEVIPVSELAEKAGTISYEILCAVSPRVPRIYVIK